jgi:hypothetical protein
LEKNQLPENSIVELANGIQTLVKQIDKPEFKI